MFRNIPIHFLKTKYLQRILTSIKESLSRSFPQRNADTAVDTKADSTINDANIVLMVDLPKESQEERDIFRDWKKSCNGGDGGS